MAQEYSTVLIDGDVVAVKAMFTAKKAGGSFDSQLKIAQAICNNLINTYRFDTNCHNYEVVIGPNPGDLTFRHKLATIKPYKGERPEKEEIYEPIREHLKSHHDAIVAKGIEADDLLGILQCDAVKDPDGQGLTIIASIDKDLLQIPGWHFNMDSREITEVRDPGTLYTGRYNTAKEGKQGALFVKGTGFKWFCCQMLLGDAIDGIPGPKRGFGPAKAYKRLEGLSEPLEMWFSVAAFYDQCGHTEARLLEIAKLLWILREPEGVFTLETLHEFEGEPL